MRLIDADKLPKYTGYALSADEVAKAVETAPTIEAIPVEWVQKRMSECVSYSIVWIVLRDLLREWERREECQDE